MRRFFVLPPADAFPVPPVVTLGMFDGVHRGHRAVLARTRACADESGAEAAALTFDTHPRGVVHAADAPPMITSLEHRLALLDAGGMDAAVVLPFDESLAAMSATDFARDILAGRLRARAVVLGPDAHFGRNREGNAAFLREHADAFGFHVHRVEPVCLADGTPVSSSAIRDAVLANRLDRAAAMLDRPVTVLGTVASGQGIGRQLGFPTLNLNLHHELHPPRGVYITRTRVGETAWPSVTNIGHRPTLDAVSREDVLIESHILDESVGDLYGQKAEVVFEKHLRAEEKFPNRDALSAQIARDVAAARAWFAGQTMPEQCKG